MTAKALIIGAGLGGLTAALALRRVGMDVDLFEQAEQLREVGAGIQLSPNAMKVMRALNLEAAVVGAGFLPQAARIRHYASARVLFDAPLNPACTRRYGAPYVHIHRADLHGCLAGAARRAGVALHLGRRAGGYVDTGNRVTVEFTDGATASGDVLIGADGLNSTIQTCMHVPRPPRYTGYTAWRGTVPTAALPPGLVDPCATVWAGPGGHVVTYLVRGGALVNFVAVRRSRSAPPQSWSRTGQSEELRGAFDMWHDRVAALLAAADSPFLWGLYDRPPLEFWCRGRVGLLGDACHPTLPFMAQGAALAMEDAWVLARALQAGPDPAAALARYQLLRRPRAAALQQRARRNAADFQLASGPGGLVSRLKLAAASLLPRRLALLPLDSVYGFDPTED